MNPAAELLTRLRERGIALALGPWPRGLVVTPADADVTQAELDAVRLHRGDLIGLLRAEAARPTPKNRNRADVRHPPR